MFFAAGVFYYFTTEQVKALFAKMAERFFGGWLVFDTAGKKAVKMMIKIWVKQAKIQNVDIYFSVAEEACPRRSMYSPSAPSSR